MNRTKMRLMPGCILAVSAGLMLLLAACGSSRSSASNPTAAFTASPETGSFPLTVTFDASASADSNGRITGYAWDFGDGRSGNGTVVLHQYWSIATYTARLTVTDDDGNTGTATRTIQVKPLYSVSGAVLAPEYMETDSDVNDTNAPYAPNDSFLEAQEVAAPASISGYVNLALSGPAGRSFYLGDPEDYYRATLNSDMRITLYMAADPILSELNLYLYDAEETLADSTHTDENGTASLAVPHSGDWYVRVEAAGYALLETASIYVLNMGNSGIEAGSRSPRLSDAFVPGEALVLFDTGVAALDAGAANAPGRLRAMGLDTDAGASGHSLRWKLPETADRTAAFRGLGVQSALGASLAPGRADTQTVSKMETLWMIRALRRTGGVRLADPNFLRWQSLYEPNDLYYPYQWHYPLLGLPEAWTIATGSDLVVVAVIDSGVLQQHPDLSGQLLGGYDFVSDPSSALDGDGIDGDPEDPGDGSTQGSSFHGTHTAGTIAARTDNGIGVAGVAWNCRILPLRALGMGGSGTSYDILEAVRYAAGMPTGAGIQLDAPVDVINLSLGGTGYSGIEAEVYREAYSRGTIIAAAAGNDGTSDINYPAGYEGVLSVSAVTIEGNAAGYSNFGPTIDVAAPGGSSTDVNGDGYLDGILSTAGDDSGGTVKMGYAFYTGTSMAAPHVAGVAALMKALYPGMTPEDFDALLSAGYLTQGYSESGPDERLGYGTIDAYKAVLVARESASSGEIPAILSVAPRSLNFGRTATSLYVTVGNSGSGNLKIDAYYPDASWLSVAPTADVDSNGFGTYAVGATRGGLAYGTYTAGVTFEAGSQRVRITAAMVVGEGTTTARGGYHYILLVDADLLSTARDTFSLEENGRYAYSFTGLRYGKSYYVYAGTDINNDVYICTDGEACGAYLSRDKPIRLTVTEDLENIDFTTDIKINIPVTSAGDASRNGLSPRRDAARQILK